MTIILAFFSSTLLAYETDQFTLPPRPLKDIGADISEYVYSQILKGVDKYNNDHPKTYETLEQVYVKDLAEDIFQSIDGGVKLTETVEGWLGNGNWAPPVLKNKYPNDYLSFRQTPDESIYRHATYHRGFGVAFKYLFSATINLFGINLGTDKLGHFFKQGHQYYDIYLEARSEGQTHEEAQHFAAYERGVKTENTYFGLALSGVFSNADLFTNYTGMKFYQNLTKDIEIGGVVYPALLKIEDGKLAFNNEDKRNDRFTLLKRFIHIHMNEARNPSFHDPIMTRAIEKNMKRVCPFWKKQYPDYNINDELLELEFLKTWWGEDYGHSLISYPERALITVGNSCFLQ